MVTLQAEGKDRMIHGKDGEFCSNRKRSELEEYQQFGFTANYNNNNNGWFPVNYRLAVMTELQVRPEQMSRSLTQSSWLPWTTLLPLLPPLNSL